MAYSSGKHAYGICDISGFRYRLNTMKKTWDGLLVGPDMYDPKHPQLQRTRKTADPEALLNPRPDVKSTIHLGVVKVSNPKDAKKAAMNDKTRPFFGFNRAEKKRLGKAFTRFITL